MIASGKKKREEKRKRKAHWNHGVVDCIKNVSFFFIAHLLTGKETERTINPRFQSTSLLPTLTTSLYYDEHVANMVVKALFSALVMVKAYTLLTLIHILL